MATDEEIDPLAAEQARLAVTNFRRTVVHAAHGVPDLLHRHEVGHPAAGNGRDQAQRPAQARHAMIGHIGPAALRDPSTWSLVTVGPEKGPVGGLMAPNHPSLAVGSN